MPTNERERTILEEQRLDALLSLAFQYDALEETQQVLSECTGHFSPEDASLCLRAFARFQKTLAQQKRQERRECRKQAHHFSPRSWKVAVCLVVLLALSVSFALAHTDFGRVNPSRLVIRKKAAYVEVEMKEDPEASFDVPTQWLGRYYPSYIPEGFEMSAIFPDTNSVEYRNAEGKMIYFDECVKGAASNIDNKNAVYSQEIVNGETAFVIEREDSTCVIWGIGTEYFYVDAYLPKEEVLKIAEGVEFIQ